MRPSNESHRRRGHPHGDYRNAIGDSALALIEDVKAKAGSTMDGTALMQSTFSTNKPKLAFGQPNLQQGYMELYTGAIRVFRNVPFHSLEEKNDEQETLEILGFLSYLFRILDKL